jgi:hypothetical protein
MVLDNKKKDEKIFLAKQARWQQIMKLLTS